MSRILKFDQVNEAGFDWRSFVGRNKKYDLYVSKVKSVEMINPPPGDKLILPLSKIKLL